MEDWKQYRPNTFEYNGKWVKNWFSNMVLSTIIVDNMMYRSVENYYQAQKSLDRYTQADIALMSPSDAKKTGRLLNNLRNDWEQIKYDVMKVGLLAKFSKPEWKEKLIATNNDVLIEWNNWNDKIWGVSIKDNKGKNLLGQALMEIRSELLLINCKKL